MPGYTKPPTPADLLGHPDMPAPKYTAPFWIKDYLDHAEQNLKPDEPLIMPLVWLHKKLLTSASATGPEWLFLEAAAVIQNLIRSHGHTAVYRDGLDVAEDTIRAATETLRVLRDWTGPATPQNAHRALRQASAWADHVNLRITAARATVQR